MQERFEDTKVVVRNCKSKVRQYNSERKKNKQDLQNTSLYRKIKNEKHEPHKKLGVNLVATEG